MVLVSESPGEDHGALGVVTLEDVIEELIGEEIVDETDVFVDVSRHLKRVNPSVAFAHHAFHRVSSRQGRMGQNEANGSDKLSRRASLSNPSSGAVKPLNKANEPNPTTSTKVTIKPGGEARNAQHAATVVSQEERLLGKKAARENYGTMRSNEISHVEEDRDVRSRNSPTLLEEIVHGNGENGKVVISPVKENSSNEDDPSRPLL